MKTKTRIIIAIVITLILSVLTIINMMGGNKNVGGNDIHNGVNSNYSNTNTTVFETRTQDTRTQDGTTNTTTTKRTSRKTTSVIRTTKHTDAKKVGTYTLTHYGPDCKGCGGTTASGYNVRNTIYYNDPTYGQVRIVAMKYMPFNSIIKIKNYKSSGDIYAIVLDRPKHNIIDLLVESESKASKLGIQENIEIEVLRSGE